MLVVYHSFKSQIWPHISTWWPKAGVKSRHPLYRSSALCSHRICWTSPCPKYFCWIIPHVCHSYFRHLYVLLNPNTGQTGGGQLGSQEVRGEDSIWPWNKVGLWQRRRTGAPNRKEGVNKGVEPGMGMAWEAHLGEPEWYGHKVTWQAVMGTRPSEGLSLGAVILGVVVATMPSGQAEAALRSQVCPEIYSGEQPGLPGEDVISTRAGICMRTHSRSDWEPEELNIQLESHDFQTRLQHLDTSCGLCAGLFTSQSHSFLVWGSEMMISHSGRLGRIRWDICEVLRAAAEKNQSLKYQWEWRYRQLVLDSLVQETSRNQLWHLKRSGFPGQKGWGHRESFPNRGKKLSLSWRTPESHPGSPGLPSSRLALCNLPSS